MTTIVAMLPLCW